MSTGLPNETPFPQTKVPPRRRAMEVPLKPGSPASAIVSNAAIVEEGTKASSPPEARYSYCDILHFFQ
jgi:hypothetical protein